MAKPANYEKIKRAKSRVKNSIKASVKITNVLRYQAKDTIYSAKCFKSAIFPSFQMRNLRKSLLKFVFYGSPGGKRML